MMGAMTLENFIYYYLINENKHDFCINTSDTINRLSFSGSCVLLVNASESGPISEFLTLFLLRF